jgi:hypothetical protein
MFINTVSRNSQSELTNIDEKTCNYIPEAVNKLALSARLDHSCETGWNKHDSSYYSKQSSKKVLKNVHLLDLYIKTIIFLFYKYIHVFNSSQNDWTFWYKSIISSVVDYWNCEVIAFFVEF